MANNFFNAPNGVGVGTRAADPSSGMKAGDIYYNTTDNCIRMYDGSSWFPLLFGSIGTPGYIAKFITNSTITDSIIYESGGNIGIGTNAPGVKLELQGASTVTQRIGTGSTSFYIQHNLTDTHIYTAEAAPLRLGTASIERLRISGSGNVQLTAYGTGLIKSDSSGNLTSNSNDVTIRVDSIAALKALDKTKYNLVTVTGYYTANDGGGGTYVYDAADGVSSDNGGSVIVATDGARWKLQITGPVSVKQFGAKGDNIQDDYAYTNAWLSYLLSSGHEGFAPAGEYRHDGRWLVDMDNSPTRTLTIKGEGPYKTKFYINTSTGPALNIYKGTPFDHFYVILRDVGFQFDIASTAAAIGLTDFSDAAGNYSFENVFFGNINTTSANADTLQINYCFDSMFKNVVAVGKVGYGNALHLRQAQFCSFIGGSYSNCSKAILMDGGIVMSNTFTCVDIENCDYCVSNESASTVKQLFVGGFWDCYRPDLVSIGTNCVNTSAGGKACIVIDNVHPVRAGTELYGGIFLASNAKDFNGRVQVRGFYGTTTPALPATTVTIANETGQHQNVTIHGGTVTDVYLRTVSTGFTGGSFVLTPGDYISVHYSSAPTWEWYPIF